MSTLDLLNQIEQLSTEQSEAVAAIVGPLAEMHVYPQSITNKHQALFGLGRKGIDKYLFIIQQKGVIANEFEGEMRDIQVDGAQLALKVCPTSAANVQALHKALPYTKPQRLGLATSAGCGDRLGLATPGHVRAMRGTGLAPIYAQQSMRENARTHRTPQQVIDDATWGVFQEGWRQGYGADADHLKSTEHIDICVDAGYTFFTIDPGDHVNNEAHTASLSRLHEIVQALPWEALETSSEALYERYLGKTWDLEQGLSLEFSDESLARAAGKYGQAIAHTALMYRHLESRTDNFELEMSVDETETVTSAEEHFFVVSELKRLGVQWVSLAPRYVGDFEKGVDYIGDLDAFAASFAVHAAIARAVGPYKLSLHSGSDKFSIYAIAARVADGQVHLKTAGTSYLEALRAIAEVNPDLFRSILELSIQRYPQERATYHVSGSLAKVPDPASLPDTSLAALLDQFDARQVLHVTYGSALDAYGDVLTKTLEENEEVYYDVLERHFDKHLQPFIVNP